MNNGIQQFYSKAAQRGSIQGLKRVILFHYLQAFTIEKIADMQAHSMALSATLRVCKSTIEFIFEYLDSMNVFKFLLL